MKVADLLSVESIDVDAVASSKEIALKKAVALMVETGVIKDEDAYLKAVFEREKESTTGVGQGVAIPHAKGDFVSKPALVALVFKKGVAYDSLDGLPVKVLFLIAAPKSEGQDNAELEVLSRLSKILMDESIVQELEKAQSPEDFLAVVSGAERHRLTQEEKESEESESDSSLPEILAVTSCPNGIAHTYMAEESLENAAKKLGVKIKVETDGTIGVGNPLTAEEIKAAKGIIVAADASVEMTRFNGKPVLTVSVAQGIKSGEALVRAILEGRAPIQGGGEASTPAPAESEFGKESVGHKLYKYLMGGVSHMIPFVIAGGILIAIAFLIDAAAGNSGAGANFGSVNPVASWFKTLGGFSMGLMLPVLAGFIAYAIAGTPALVVGFVGGFICTTNTFSIGYTVAVATQNETLLEQMNATSGFLGAIVAGFLAGYIIVLFKKWFAWMPKSVEGLKSMLVFPLLGVLSIGFIMYIFNTPLQYVSLGFSMLLRQMMDAQVVVLACVIVAAMMAVDMGGPINKAAYVFGVACLTDAIANPANAEADYMIMAAVMIGGMVHPIAIALAADLFPVKWSKKERTDSKVNYILGLSFITEGAIPYAASYPLPVIGSSVIGSAVSGLVSGLFRVQLLAPHGGIFVFPVVSSTVGSSGAAGPIGILWYLVALVLGSAVGALSLGIFMKDNPNPEIGKFKGIFHVNLNFGKRKNKAQ